MVKVVKFFSTRLADFPEPLIFNYFWELKKRKEWCRNLFGDTTGVTMIFQHISEIDFLKGCKKFRSMPVLLVQTEMEQREGWLYLLR